MGVQQWEDCCVIFRAPHHLATWNDKQFKDIPKEISKCKIELNRLQSSPRTVEAIQASRSLENIISALLRKEEVFWLQCSRVSWMREGDMNTKFFHKIASGRRRRNQIDVIVDEFGVTWKEEEDIQRVFVDYFLGLFTAESNLDMGEALGAVENKINGEMLTTLSQPFTEKEVTKALFQIHPCKASGPDSRLAIFFQKF